MPVRMGVPILRRCCRGPGEGAAGAAEGQMRLRRRDPMWSGVPVRAGPFPSTELGE